MLRTPPTHGRQLRRRRPYAGTQRGAFVESGIDTLVTSCPICLRTFREDYHLDGIRLCIIASS